MAGIPPIRVAVAFCSDVAINEANLRAALKEHVREGTPPDTLLLMAIGTNETKRTLSALVSSEDFRRSLPSTTSQLGGVNAVWMDQHGSLGGAGEGKAIFTDASAIELVRQQGLRKIFTLRKGMLDPQGTYHYIIPRSAHSERHCDRFIRTGNVLVKSSEISFVSFWLLPYLRVDTRNIYTDTAAINSVAYAVVALRTQLDRRYKHPRIESFSSHEGLASAELELDGSLVLISASAGGKLQPRLRKEKHFRPEQIVTIYCIGPKPGTQYLCDLTKEKSNPEGFDLIRGFSRSDCPHCRRGVLAIRIKGDQFFPENPEPAEHDVRGQDAPRWLRDFMEDFRGSNVIKCHAQYPTHTSRVRELYLDLLPVLDPGRLTESDSPKKFKQKLERLLTQVIPASLGRIIYPDEPASTALAQMTLAKFHNDHPSSTVEILSTQEMDSILRDPILKQGAVRDEGATLAMSCALVEGSRLTTSLFGLFRDSD